MSSIFKKLEQYFVISIVQSAHQIVKCCSESLNMSSISIKGEQYLITFDNNI